MKRLSANDEIVTFQISRRERDALRQLLQTYPVLPPAHQIVSKELKGQVVTEYQRLLDEALAEQRAANQRHLRDWLAKPGRFSGVQGRLSDFAGAGGFGMAAPGAERHSRRPLAATRFARTRPIDPTEFEAPAAFRVAGDGNERLLPDDYSDVVGTLTDRQP